MQTSHANTTIVSSSYSNKVIVAMIAVGALILFACSSLRHLVFQSTAFDLGYFDQAIYLISQGQPPIVSFWGYHFLGGHADWVLYLLAGLYRIYPSVYWLFAIQAAALALGTLPIWHLARMAGLKDAQALATSAAYLLYPLIFNLNMFDFHPEVMALPTLLAAILAARLERKWWFCVSIIFILGCRAALSLTVAAMGLWLLVFEKKRFCGIFALCAGIAWFLIATQLIIPAFRPDGVEAVGRYAYLGNSLPEVMLNIVLKPGLVLGKVFSRANLTYIWILLLPVIWGLSPGHLAPLVGAIPTVIINIISDHQLQKDLMHQYSLPALPFLLLAVISSLAAGKGWLRDGRAIALWSLVAFLTLVQFSYFGSQYMESLDTRQATVNAIAQIKTSGGVLTTSEIVPHLTHRKLVKYTDAYSSPPTMPQFDYVLLNIRHPGLQSTPEFATKLLIQLKNTRDFTLNYQHDDVYLFKRINGN